MKQIDGFENYCCTIKGEVFSKLTNKWLKPQLSSSGYYHYALSKNKKIVIKSMHCIIAENFIKTIDNKQLINYINGIKTDNRIENLEWVTQSENMKHAFKLNLCNTTINGVKKLNFKLVLDTQTGVFYNLAKEVADLYNYKENVFRNKLNKRQPAKNDTQFVFC